MTAPTRTRATAVTVDTVSSAGESDMATPVDNNFVHSPARGVRNLPQCQVRSSSVNDLSMLRGGGCGKPGDNTLWMELNRCFVVGWAFLLICCATW